MDDCEWIAGNALKQENLYFHSNFLVKSLLRHLVQSQSFSIGIIKRGISRYFINTGVTSHRPAPLDKPNALNVLQMFDPQLFQSGSIKLDPSSSYLRLLLLSAPLGCSEELLLFRYVALHRIRLAYSLFLCLYCPSLSCLYPAVAIMTLPRCVQLRFSTPSIPPP